MTEFSQRDFIRRTNMLYQPADKLSSLLFGQYGERCASAKRELRQLPVLQAGPNWRDDRNSQ
jgi:hypothetical protein